MGVLSPSLVAQCEFFEMYSAYMNEFKVAMKTLAKYEHSSQAFRQELRSQQAECDGLSLSSFLLTPVQRLPRYELLLKVSQSELLWVKSLKKRSRFCSLCEVRQNEVFSFRCA